MSSLLSSFWHSSPCLIYEFSNQESHSRRPPGSMKRRVCDLTGNAMVPIRSDLRTQTDLSFWFKPGKAIIKGQIFTLANETSCCPRASQESRRNCNYSKSDDWEEFTRSKLWVTIILRSSYTYPSFPLSHWEALKRRLCDMSLSRESTRSTSDWLWSLRFTWHWKSGISGPLGRASSQIGLVKRIRWGTNQDEV